MAVPNQDSPTPPWQASKEVESEEETEVSPEPSTELPQQEAEAVQEEPLTETLGAETSEIPPEETSSEIPVSAEFPSPTEEMVAEEIPQPVAPVKAFHLPGGSSLGPLKKILPLVLGLILVVGLIVLVIQVVLPRLGEVEISLPGQQVTLDYWGLWEPDEVMAGVLADWQEEHPNIKINYSMQSKQEYRERLQSALARDEGPDLFRYHIAWLPMLRNELEPVPTEIMSAAEFSSAYYPIAVTQLRSGTSYLGIPLEIDTLALFYNKEIFQTAGKTPPTTWDALRQVAIELTTRDESGRIQTAGAAVGTTNNVEHWSDILGLMMLQNEADLANPTGPKAQDALDYYTLFNTDKNNQVWNETLPNSTLAFANGKVAMYFGFSWEVFEIQYLNPDLEFGVVKAPQMPGTNINWASFWVEGVNSKSLHKKEAWEFLKYLSQRETLAKLYQAQSQVRLFGEPYPRIDMAELAKANSMVAPFVEQAPTAQTWYLCSRTYDNGINDRMIEYFKNAVNAVNDGEDSEDALETAASGVAQLLSQYNIASMVTR